MAARIVGCDVGGTFTDLVLLDEGNGTVRIAKVPTTVDNQAIGFMAAIAAAGTSADQLDLLVHGTTTTTNALLEKKIARCGLITTRGFRDVLELGRRTRPNAYGMNGTFEPLIGREYRFEVDERMDASGAVVQPLDEAGVRAATQALLDLGCESLVIHFLHAYANPAHEKRAAEVAAELWPNDHITVGSDILAEFREYERGVAAAVNGAIRPVLSRYLARLNDELLAQGYTRDLLVMQGNGGSVAARVAADAAINTVMSGPASGVMAAAYTGSRSGYADIITYDMGGTSSDVGLIRNGIPATSSELQLEYGMPIHVPMVDVHTIGAGGGSIAFINEAGMLQVGPKSAGANPGPICYGRGGEEPTITDANLVLGRLNPEALLAVDAPVSLDHVKDLIEAKVGRALGMNALDAAAAILRIGNDRMAGAVRMVSLSRGHDPRDFALFAFGGAGPLHATALAAELAIPTVLIPALPGITNAIGCVVADMRHDYVQSINEPLQIVEMERVHAILAAQAQEGRQLLAEEGIAAEQVVVVHDCLMQFQGQSHMLQVAIPDGTVSRDALQEAFETAYYERFSLRLPEIRAVLVTLHTAVLGRRDEVALSSLIGNAEQRGGVDDARIGTRQVWFEGGWRETPILRREALPLGGQFEGPAIVEQLDTTVTIEPGNQVDIDAVGNLLISVAPAFKD